MNAVHRIIQEINELPRKDKLHIAIALHEELYDEHLDELDLLESDRIYKEWKQTGKAEPAERVFQRLESK